MGENTTPHTYDVFLSHNSKDKPTVQALAQRLRDAGLTVWLDERDLVPGEPWQEGLEEGLARSRTVVVAIGPAGIGPWQNEELRLAIDTRAREPDRRVIPVLLPGAEPELPPLLSRFAWVDFRNGLDDAHAFQRLLDGIQGRGAPSIAPPRSAPVRPASDPTYHATVHGPGAVAQGPGAVAAGKGGVAIGGDVKGSTIITGNGNTVQPQQPHETDEDEEAAP